jgi:glycyl-tRNA synthetase beta chain
MDGKERVGVMTDFLLELRSEEIPARMQDKARDDLARMFTAELAKAGLQAAEIVTYATPRRLALIAKGLPLETEAVSEETKGPKAGAPPQAMEGFLRKVGLTQDQLIERDGVYFAVVEKPGRKTADVLAEAIPAIIRAFPWPKSQRWGAASASTESLRWVRPLQGIIALLGDDVVPCEVDGIVSSAATMGHRFMRPIDTVRPEPVEGRFAASHASTSSALTVIVKNAASYTSDLRAFYVILDHNERRDIIRAGAQKAAINAGLTLVPDEGLVNENSGLTEWPVPMLGRFDAAFLDVPPEVIQLTARVNQKYFVCHDASGKLANAFVCTANITAKDGGAAIVAGNEKVLAARLSDAKFFWEADKKVPLKTQAEKLSSIVFHEKLGTVADKVERVAKLARWLVMEGVIKPRAPGEDPEPSASNATGSASSAEHNSAVAQLANQAERAARLCKADLVTGMVGEFPELQGIMGGYYARAQGEAGAVADAVRDHYKPVGQGDDVPTAPVTVAVSLADKLDTLVGFFFEDMPPTGSKDPFALRRATIGVVAAIVVNKLAVPLQKIFLVALEPFAERVIVGQSPVRKHQERIALHNAIFGETLTNQQRVQLLSQHGLIDLYAKVSKASSDLLDFFADRLKVQQREAGVRHDLIDAVFALGGEDDLVRLLARVKALQEFVTTDEGVNLLAGYKRAANILKQSGAPAQAGAGAESAQLGTQLLPSQEHGENELLPSQENSEEVVLPVHELMVDEERALQSALTAAEPLAAAAIEAEDFAAAMTALASLRAPIDAFFDGVMVNDPDPDKRSFRIGLLTRFRDAVHKVADFSKIEG